MHLISNGTVFEKYEKGKLTLCCKAMTTRLKTQVVKEPIRISQANKTILDLVFIIILKKYLMLAPLRISAMTISLSVSRC